MVETKTAAATSHEVAVAVADVAEKDVIITGQEEDLPHLPHVLLSDSAAMDSTAVVHQQEELQSQGPPKQLAPW